MRPPSVFVHHPVLNTCTRTRLTSRAGGSGDSHGHNCAHDHTTHGVDGAGALGVAMTTGARSLLPGGQEEAPTGGADPSTSEGSSDDGGATEPAPEPGAAFDE